MLNTIRSVLQLTTALSKSTVKDFQNKCFQIRLWNEPVLHAKHDLFCATLISFKFLLYLSGGFLRQSRILLTPIEMSNLISEDHRCAISEEDLRRATR